MPVKTLKPWISYLAWMMLKLGNVFLIFIRWCLWWFRFLEGCHDPSGPEGCVDHGHAHAPHEGVGRPHCEAGGLVDEGDTGRAHRPKRDGDDETHQKDQQGVVPGPKRAKLYYKSPTSTSN